MPALSLIAGPLQHFKAAVLDAWRNKVAGDLCGRKGFRGKPLLDIHGSLQLLNSSHVRERDKGLLRGVMVGGVWNGFLLGRVRKELNVLPVSWFDELARILTLLEDHGVWPDGLLDAYITMIPKTDGDATPLGQRPLSVLPVVYRIWASSRMVQLEGWFKSWVPDSVFSAGGGRGSVEAWYTSAFDIEEVLSGAVDSHVHLFCC